MVLFLHAFCADTASRSWEEDFKDLSSTKRERDGEEGERGGRFKYEYARHAPVSKTYNIHVRVIVLVITNKKQTNNNNQKQNNREDIRQRSHRRGQKMIH